MIGTILLLLLTSICLASDAEVIETWICEDDYTGEVLFTARVHKGRLRGEIEVAGVTHKTKFTVQGFLRRWDFGWEKSGEKGGGYNYALGIEPNGSGRYFDFHQVNPGGNESILEFWCEERNKKPLRTPAVPRLRGSS